MDVSRSARRMILGLAALILVVGVGAALLLPPRDLGPCSVFTEFHCGQQPRTALKWLLGVGGAALAMPLLVWARKPRSRMSRPRSK